MGKFGAKCCERFFTSWRYFSLKSLLTKRSTPSSLPPCLTCGWTSNLNKVTLDYSAGQAVCPQLSKYVLASNLNHPHIFFFGSQVAGVPEQKVGHRREEVKGKKINRFRSVSRFFICWEGRSVVAKHSDLSVITLHDWQSLGKP